MPNLDDYPELRAEAFLERFPEFKTAGLLITAALTDAATRVNAVTYGDAREVAIQWMAAHILAVSPYGRSQRLVNDDGTTNYLKEFEKIKAENTPGMIVL